MDWNDLHVIVVGGGLGGLAVTLLLARRGHRVTLVERDADAPRGSPDQLFSGWARPGVPQAQAQADAAMARRIQAAVADQPTLPLDPAERLRHCGARYGGCQSDPNLVPQRRGLPSSIYLDPY